MAVAGRTRTRLDPATRREQILDAAARVLTGRDPAEVTFEEIASAAGVSRALVYNYFGDRGGLVAAVYLRSLRQLDDALEQAIATTANPSERLRRVIACYLEYARDQAGAANLVSAAEAVLHPAVQEARRRRYERIASVWGGSPEAHVLARALVGFLEGASLEWNDGSCGDLDRVVLVLHTVLWRGLAHLGDAGLALGASAATTAPAHAVPWDATT